MLVGALGASSQAQADYVIDSFDESNPGIFYVADSSATGTGSSALAPLTNLTVDPTNGSTDLINAQRATSATVASTDGNAAIVQVSLNVGGSSLVDIQNSSNATSTAQFNYTFDALNFAATTAQLSAYFSATGNFSVDILVNGADSGWQNFTDSDTSFSLLFSSFSDPSQFTSVHSITLKYQGAQGVDTNFTQFFADGTPATPAPEPATIALMGLGLAGFAAARKKKQA